jgi:zinc transporter 9
VDFDGTYLAAKLLNRYQDEFLNSKDLKEDLRVLLAWYAEDVTRTVEREVREVEAEIRARYPEAMYIELEPDSKERDSYAIDNMKETRLRRIENDTINQMLAELRITKPGYGKSTQEAPAKHANPETSMEKAKK